jgi:hypothetical protein
VYDNAGRRTQIGGTLASLNLPATLASATYDADNRLTNWSSNTLTYDANGDLTGDGSLTYGWDSRGRLASLSGTAAASFTYDTLGRRTGKTVNGAATNFLYDGPNVAQELASGTPTANLLLGLDIDEVYSRTDGLGARSFVTDALGSTVALTDTSGESRQVTRTSRTAIHLRLARPTPTLLSTLDERTTALAFTTIGRVIISHV